MKGIACKIQGYDFELITTSWLDTYVHLKMNMS